MFPNGPPTSQRAQNFDFGGLPSGLQYSLQDAGSLSLANDEDAQTPLRPTRARHYPYPQNQPRAGQVRRRDSGIKADERGETSGSVRRRISRACDQCNQLRTKCDGGTPCSHCIEFGLSCEYFRERKKRGKASRKDLAEQEAAASMQLANPPSPTEYSSEDPSSNHPYQGGHAHLKTGNSFAAETPLPSVPRRTIGSSESIAARSAPTSRLGDLSRATSMIMASEIPVYKDMSPQQQHLSALHQPIMPDHQLLQVTPDQTREMSASGSLAGFNFVQSYDRSRMQNLSSINSTRSLPSENTLHQVAIPSASANQYSHYNEGIYPLMDSQDGRAMRTTQFGRNSETPLTSMMAASPVSQSPEWLSLPSPSGSSFQSQQYQLTPHNSLRYPVLQPLLPSIAGILPTALACELLELYFSSSTSAPMRPLSPYILGFVFRKQSFLHPSRPRICSPALLCSMLWVAAQTSDATFLTSLPATRGRICQKLLELTVDLLRPLIHGPSQSDNPPNHGINSVIDGIALGGLGVASPYGDRSFPHNDLTGAVDAVATYIHLATVVSASEYKAASLRWWNAAWSLARELKLGRELPPNPPQPPQLDQSQGEEADGDYDLDIADLQHTDAPVHERSPFRVTAPAEGIVSEEEREERRRVWWLVYTMDRHLALCYNRPLFLLDIECEGLLQPIDDALWQAGELFTSDAIHSYRHRGPSFECASHSIFGFFTPLMTILGEIVDLHHAQNHPKFGIGFKGAAEWDDRVAEITQQLGRYAQSLKEFEARCSVNLQAAEQIEDSRTPSIQSPCSRASRTNESILQTKTVVAYGTDVMHVLHIALAGKWDPISLLDDNDLWISSQSFVTATGHAVSAAEAVSDILEYDPDLSFMPFFFGIYLLQGSFLLLLIADKLQGEASPGVVKACETIVRAHEACIVTLNTEYQRNFRKVMRSALAQVKGRVIEDFGEQQLRRREVLALYRWTGDGTGLAL